MITLYAPPFNIKDGNLIQFRAYAKNEICWSRPSELNVIGENLIGKPAKVTNLQITDSDEESVVLEWNSVVSETG